MYLASTPPMPKIVVTTEPPTTKKQYETSQVTGEHFALKEWLSEEPISDLRDVCSFIKGLTLTRFSERFCERRLLIAVFAASKLEGTLPTSFAGKEASEFLDDLHKKIAAKEELDEGGVWNVYGRDVDEQHARRVNKHQLKQLLLAGLFLESAERIDVETIVRCHSIMMKGAIDDNNKLIKPGFREHAMCGGDGHVFLEPKHISAALDKVMKQYTAYMEDDKSFLAASYLFYMVTNIRPFVYGNGRLCRLLLAASLCKSGFPFMVTLPMEDDQHDLMHAINSARRPCFGEKDLQYRLAELNALALMSAVSVMDNYKENMSFYSKLSHPSV